MRITYEESEPIIHSEVTPEDVHVIYSNYKLYADYVKVLKQLRKFAHKFESAKAILKRRTNHDTQ